MAERSDGHRNLAGDRSFIALPRLFKKKRWTKSVTPEKPEYGLKRQANHSLLFSPEVHNK